MATASSITISMSQQTVNDLQDGGFTLCGFKAVGASQRGGQPLVWFTSTALGQILSIKWAGQYEIYTSHTAIAPGVTITDNNSYPADLGQCLNVTDPAGTGTIVNGTVPMALEITNSTSVQLTAGIGQAVYGTANLVCAFPLYGNTMGVMQPIEQVALLFTTQPVNPGMVLEQAYASGILLDLTTNPNATIAFDINTGWSGSNVPTQPVSAGTPLASLLIIPNSELAAVAAKH